MFPRKNGQENKPHHLNPSCSGIYSLYYGSLEFPKQQHGGESPGWLLYTRCQWIGFDCSDKKGQSFGGARYENFPVAVSVVLPDWGIDKLQGTPAR